jgi:hypothetical protein
MAITSARLERGASVVVLGISPENIEAAGAQLDAGDRLTWVGGSVGVQADVKEVFRVAAEG